MVSQGWRWVRAGGGSMLKAEIMLNYTAAQVHPTYNPEFLAGILIKGSVPFSGQLNMILKFIDLLDGCGTL